MQERKKKDAYRNGAAFILFILVALTVRYAPMPSLPVEAIIEEEGEQGASQASVSTGSKRAMPRSAFTGRVQPLGFSWPLPQRRAGRGYGWRRGAFDRTKIVFHNGVDIVAKEGTSIFAAASGKVYRARYMGACGNGVILEHLSSQGFRRITTTYCHLVRFHVEEGQTVERQAMLGEVGSTGASTTPHLHLATHVNGKHIDPLPHFEGMP